MFGTPGARNEKTITDHSTLFNDIMNGQWSSVLRNSVVSGNELKSLYFLVDGIYHRYFFLALPYSSSRSKKKKAYGLHHSSATKAVEICFVVRFRQFFML